ncbi:MAG: transcriptional repressor [Fimbriimonadaceae bacterium]|nr:transcriptional repressor [Fimbriimonadaceae bacterium]QYK57717.1 MAG: transcriptional repressor [Fimbriimonadaceae bacterium]
MPDEADSGSHAPNSGAFERLAIERLRAFGHRVTGPRRIVLKTLAKANKPLSAYGIHQAVTSGGGKIDVVSVYRILSTLTQIGVVHHVGIVDGYVACALGSDHSDHAGHVVCEECGTVAELDLSASVLKAANEQVVSLGYLPHQTRIEVLALCRVCRKTG